MSKQSAESIKARLKNKGRETGKTFQELLIAYGMERTIYRISVSRFSSNFTLKGGVFLYAVFDGDFVRTTADIDLLAQHINNDEDKMKQVFRDIFSVETDDPLLFDIDSMEVHPITEFKEYQGVNISVMSYLDKTKIKISIDVGFGDVVFPHRIKMDFPVILSDETPQIYAYSLSSCVAEKFEAIVSLGYDNSRLKDFYDLYMIASGYDFDRSELRGAIEETFGNRNTGFADIVVFEGNFASDIVRNSRWVSFTQKKKAMVKITFQETIDMIYRFIFPVVEDIQNNFERNLTWNHNDLSWI